MRPTRVAIVGSRGYPRLDLVRGYVGSLAPGTVVITGSWWVSGRQEPTSGVDRAAAIEAARVGLVVVLVAGSPQRDRGAGLQRNPIVVDIADQVVAFWGMISDGLHRSPGTGRTIAHALEAGVEVRALDEHGQRLDPATGQMAQGRT